ncbi:MAG: HEAT repeat domain-containing protein [Kofleriaceae bacterium]
MAGRIIDVRPGEYRRVVRAGAAMFAILAGFTISETARDSLFLGLNGAGSLALAYLALAGIAVLALVANAWLVRKVGRRAALVVTLVAAAAGTAAFYAIPRGAIASLVLYLWTGLVGTVVVVQFWLLASTRFTSAEAKRLYGPIAASGATGTLAGALVAWGLVLVFEVETLLPVASGFYVVAAVLLARDNERVEPRLGGARARPRRVLRASTIRRHGYVIRMGMLTICATAVALLADYLLKTTAAASLRTDELAHFFARFSGVVALLSLAFQLIGSAWLVRKIGVLGMVMLLPVLLLIGGTASVLTAGSFVAVGFTKGADASLRYSVNRVSTELLWMPVAEHIRLFVREPLESVVTRLVQAITALLLLLLVVLGLASTAVVSWILSGIAIVWVFAAAGLRTRYLGQLRRSLGRRPLDPHQELDLKAIQAVVQALASDDDRRVIAAIQVLAARRSKLIPARLLRHDSLEVKVATLEAIATPPRTDWIPIARELSTDSDPRVRALVLRALARTGDETAIVAGLCDDDPGVAALGVFWSLRDADTATIAANPAVAAVVHEPGTRGSSARGQFLQALMSDGDARWLDVMLDLTKTVEEANIDRLALAIAHVPDPRLIPFLFSRLGTRAGRQNVRAALVEIGEPALAALEQALTETATLPPRVRLHLPTTIATFATPRAAEILGAQLAREVSDAMRYRLLKALARLAMRDEIIIESASLLAELELHLEEYGRLLAIAVPIFASDDERDSARLLRGMVTDKISQALDRAFLTLQSLHPREDIREIQRAVEGSDPSTRAHGVEFLDTLTRTPLYANNEARGIRDRLLVIGENLDDRERLTRVGLHTSIPATVAEAVARLLEEPDALLSACAAYYALELKSPDLTTAVRAIAVRRPLFEPLGIVHANFDAS